MQFSTGPLTMSTSPISMNCRARSHRLTGLTLLMIASLLVVSRVLSVVFDPGTLSAVLLALGVIAAFAISRTEAGFTSLIGLFFLTTCLFNLGRPVLGLILRDESAYELTFGFTVSTPDNVKADLLLFWCVGIAAFVGGYFVLYRGVGPHLRSLGTRIEGYCRRCFWLTLLIVAVIIPVTLRSSLATFLAEGYAGLYANQTGYTFSLSRALDFLLPTLFGLAILLRESRYMRLVVLAVTANGVAGLIVGQRAAVGQWVLVGVWYLSNIRGKRIKRWLLVCAAVVLIVFFQLVAGWRDGYDSYLTVAEFMVEQGVTFVLPIAITQLTPPEPHTIVASLLPLGGVYSALGVGTAADRSLGNYLSSSFNATQFAQGYGLGGTFYLELFYASGGLWVCYLFACALGGIFLRKWEESSSRDNLSLFYLCICIPSIIFLPRGTISAITSQIIYGSLYMLAIYLFDWLINSPSRLESPASRMSCSTVTGT